MIGSNAPKWSIDCNAAMAPWDRNTAVYSLAADATLHYTPRPLHLPAAPTLHVLSESIPDGCPSQQSTSACKGNFALLSTQMDTTSLPTATTSDEQHSYWPEERGLGAGISGPDIEDGSTKHSRQRCEHAINLNGRTSNANDCGLYSIGSGVLLQSASPNTSGGARELGRRAHYSYNELLNLHAY